MWVYPRCHTEKRVESTDGINAFVKSSVKTRFHSLSPFPSPSPFLSSPPICPHAGPFHCLSSLSSSPLPRSCQSLLHLSYLRSLSFPLALHFPSLSSPLRAPSTSFPSPVLLPFLSLPFTSSYPPLTLPPLLFSHFSSTPLFSFTVPPPLLSPSLPHIPLFFFP